MKLDFNKIINIKSNQDLKSFDLTQPIFNLNYLFHYLIYLDNLAGLKLYRFPIYIENSDGLNGFHLAAKEGKYEILEYLIKTYPEYIYNRTSNREAFTAFLEYELFSKLIRQFNDLDWDDLINNGTSKQDEILANIVTNLNYTDLKQFINVYKIKPSQNTQYLFGIVKNYVLTPEEKIKILDNFSDIDINIKNKLGDGLIFPALKIDGSVKLVEYLIKRNIDLDYYTFLQTDNPLRFSIYLDVVNNENKLSKIILSKVKITPELCSVKNKYLDNLAHFIIFINKKNPNNKLDVDIKILEQCDSNIMNDLNIDTMSPLELLIDLNYEKYSPIIIKNKIKVSKKILENISKILDPTDNIKKWIKLYNKQDEYIESNNVILDNSPYSHSTLFQAKFKDMGIFSLYLSDTYNELLVPNLTSYMINNITFDDTFPFSDDIISREPIFPWVISYHNQNEYYIHPYLNNIINATRRDKSKRFGLVFLSLIYDKMLHANILVYDFKNMTIERFEPYGNTELIDSNLDNVLEEELTWNTGLKYIRPKDYLPYAGFQTVSDETNQINIKAGDYGGFCLAWSLWYLESRLKNPDIEQKYLVDKLIRKMIKSELKFSEHIRNYSTKINEHRIKYLKAIGIDERDISNTQTTIKTDTILANYLINRYNGLNKNKTI